MQLSTLSFLRCPSLFRKKTCGALLQLKTPSSEKGDILSGTLQCATCPAKYPILAGVAVVVPDVRTYLIHHAKGIAKLVADIEIPKEFRKDFIAAKEAALSEGELHIEEDLEADRVNALYFMNHYLSAGSAPTSWWAPGGGSGSPLIEELVTRFWDHGPFAEVKKWSESRNAASAKTRPTQTNWVELGCGVGGLARVLASESLRYLGVDSAFASIALARHLLLGAPYPDDIRIPEDLLSGGTSRKVETPKLGIALSENLRSQVDFVVGEAERAPLVNDFWDVSVSLNMIDMLEAPEVLPRVQYGLLGPGGVAIQACPYIWHPSVARRLRKRVGGKTKDSAEAVKQLYEAEGFRVTQEIRHLPWLFFKHVRQLEIYSIHYLRTEKTAERSLRSSD